MKVPKANRPLTFKTSTKSKVFLGVNTKRHQVSFQNNSPFTLYLSFDEEVTNPTRAIKIPPDALYELPGPDPVFPGAIFGMWSGEGKGFCTVIEIIK